MIHRLRQTPRLLCYQLFTFQDSDLPVYVPLLTILFFGVCIRPHSSTLETSGTISPPPPLGLKETRLVRCGSKPKTKVSSRSVPLFDPNSSRRCSSPLSPGKVSHSHPTDVLDYYKSNLFSSGPPPVPSIEVYRRLNSTPSPYLE